MYYAVYTDEGIWAIGDTPENATKSYLDATGLDELTRERIAPMADRYGEWVAQHGYDCKRDGFDILPGGTLDFAEDACAVGHFLDARDCKLYPAGCKACYEGTAL